MAFQFEFGDLIEQAHYRIGVDPATLSGNNIIIAKKEFGLMLSSWATDKAVPFTYQHASRLLATDEDYIEFPDDTIDIVDVVLRVTDTTGQQIDTNLQRFLLHDWNAISDKTQTGVPVGYYLDKANQYILYWPLLSEELIIERSYFFEIDYIERTNDSINPIANMNVVFPFEWYDAVCWGLAARLFHPKANPALMQNAMQQAQISYDKAAGSSIIRGSFYIGPSW